MACYYLKLHASPEASNSNALPFSRKALFFATCSSSEPCSVDPKPSSTCSVRSNWPTGALATTVPWTSFSPLIAHVAPSSLKLANVFPDCGSNKTLSSSEPLPNVSKPYIASVTTLVGLIEQAAGSITVHASNVRLAAWALDVPPTSSGPDPERPAQVIFKLSEGVFRIAASSTIALVLRALVPDVSALPLTNHPANADADATALSATTAMNTAVITFTLDITG